MKDNRVRPAERHPPRRPEEFRASINEEVPRMLELVSKVRMSIK